MATPVMGVSWPDACDYVAWRNERARAAGEPWEYALPTGREYEQAARGADGRLFPWGNRFDPSLTVTRFRKQDWLLHAPAGFEPYDESVYGIRDLAGSREEWLADPGSNAEMRGKRGGSWGSSNEVIYRSAGRGEAGAARAESTQGIRLVARPR
jgi:formylglycine-generating enzyme required for sulfatase activity